MNCWDTTLAVNEAVKLNSKTICFFIEKSVTTVEETKNEGKKSDKDGSTRELGMADRKQSPWILVHNAYSCRQHGNDKKKD